MEWASWHLDPRNDHIKRHCNLCQQERDGIVCLRDQEGHNGSCPMMDDAPVLARANNAVAVIWEQAQRSANQVEGKHKTHIYCKPESVEALLRMHSVPEDEWAKCMKQVAQMDDVANGLRPIRKTT